MPQTFVAVQCAFCHAFQGTLDKKNKKYACAVCGQKQSFRHVHAISNSGKDIRKVVQEMNELRGAHDHALGQIDTAQDNFDISNQQPSRSEQVPAVEWEEFADPAEQQDAGNDFDEAGPFVTALPDGSGSRRQRSAGGSNKRQKLQQDDVGYQSCSTTDSAWNCDLPGSNMQQISTRPKPIPHRQLKQQQAAPANNSTVLMPSRPAQPHSQQHFRPAAPQKAPQHGCQHSSTAVQPQPLQPLWGTSANIQQQKQGPPTGLMQPPACGAAAAGMTQVVQQQLQQPKQQRDVPAYPAQQAHPYEHPAGVNIQQQEQQITHWGQKQHTQSTQQQQPVLQAHKPPRPPGQQQIKPKFDASRQQQPQKPRQDGWPAAAGNAWGNFVDEEAAVYSSDDDNGCDLDEQGFCSMVPLAAAATGAASAVAGSLSKWA